MPVRQAQTTWLDEVSVRSFIEMVNHPEKYKRDLEAMQTRKAVAEEAEASAARAGAAANKTLRGLEKAQAEFGVEQERKTKAADAVAEQAANAKASAAAERADAQAMTAMAAAKMAEANAKMKAADDALLSVHRRDEQITGREAALTEGDERQGKMLAEIVERERTLNEKVDAFRI